MRTLNKIYGLVQARRCLFNIFCDDRTAIGFEQSEANPCVFRKFDDGDVKMVVVVHVGILAHSNDQAKMKRFAADLEEKFKVKSMVEKLGVEKARTPASLGVPTLSKLISRKPRKGRNIC